jgi:hypothetical protein
MSTSSKDGALEKPSREPSAESAKPSQAGKIVDEAEVFPPGVDPQYFGSGSYGLGGSNQEGNYGLGETNPQGGYGQFSDSGGYGASTLYGLDVPPADRSAQQQRPAEPAPEAVKKDQVEGSKPEK